MANFILFLSLMISLPLWANSLPRSYTELNDYVQTAPDQGESNTCLFVGSTGAMELIANKKEGIKHPRPYGKYDLSEAYIIHAPRVPTLTGAIDFEVPIQKFNWGHGIHISEWDFQPWNGNNSNPSVWNYRDYSKMKKITLPKVTTEPLFVIGNRWSTGVLNDYHIQEIKEALWKYKSPVLVNYNDDGYWHVVLITGYDDDMPGNCYDASIPAAECEQDVGSFYVRDSFGIPLEIRDYDWFRHMGNAAISVREAK